MDTIFIILIKLLGSSALLWGFYFLLFRGRASFRASRVFLLCIPLLSVVFSIASIESHSLHLVSVSSLLERSPKSAPEAQYTPDTPAEREMAFPAGLPEDAVFTEPAEAIAYAYESSRSVSTETILGYAYMLIVTVILGTIIRQMMCLRSIRRRAERRTVMGSPTYFSHEIRSAFSVIKSIYVNPLPPAEKLEIIIRHEKQHILHRHYIDLALMELFTVLMWFNPFVWIIRRELRSVHEFQVDRSVLDGGVPMRDYMLAILEEAAGVIPSLANGMKSSIIKKRFVKMKKEKKIRLRALRIALTLPFMFTLLAFFAFTPAQPADVTIEADIRDITPEATARVLTAGNTDIAPLPVEATETLPSVTENPQKPSLAEQQASEERIEQKVQQTHVYITKEMNNISAKRDSLQALAASGLIAPMEMEEHIRELEAYSKQVEQRVNEMKEAIIAEYVKAGRTENYADLKITPEMERKIHQMEKYIESEMAAVASKYEYMQELAANGLIAQKEIEDRVRETEAYAREAERKAMAMQDELIKEIEALAKRDR